jgi:hypothetical protein
VAAAVIIAAVVALRPRTHPQPATAARVQPDLSARWKIGPTLSDLRANFATLRHPATAADRAAVATFRYAIGVGRQMRFVLPEEVRPLGRIDGAPVYLVVDPLFRHRTTGPVAAHMMSLAVGNDGVSWGPENYLIFPTMLGQSGDIAPSDEPATLISVVPDGVRRVKWRFACGSDTSAAHCQLPAQRVVVLPVHDNLVSLQVSAPTSWSPDGNVATVTWYGADGLTRVFTNARTAVPFPGAPATRA